MVRRTLLANKPVITFRNIQIIRPVGSGSASLFPSFLPPLVYRALITVAFCSTAGVSVLRTHLCQVFLHLLRLQEKMN